MKLNKLIPLSDELYAKLVFLVLVAMIVAIPSSRFLMSVSQISFGVLWLAHGRYIQKWRAFIQSPPALILVFLYLFHLFGVTYSSDIEYALKDIRTKLPILIIPFMFVGFPKISSKQFEKLLYFFIGSVLVVSFYVSIVHFMTHEEMRHIISRDFISHIRFSLSVNLAIFYLAFILIRKGQFKWTSMLYILVLLWLLFFLFLLQAFTGVIVFGLLIFCVLAYFAILSNNIHKKLLVLGVIIIGFLSVGYYLYNFVQKYMTIEDFDIEHADQYTVSGNRYQHHLNLEVENGKHVYVYMCEKEMRQTWRKRSSISYDSIDHLNQRIKYTLIRYLNSKDLRRDKEGIEALTDEDVINIENGIANYHYTYGLGVESRLMKILFEYQNYIRTGDPSGHSVMQRVEFWKTSKRIIADNFWIGVGTGDMNVAFQAEYIEMGSKLKENARLRAHNQYLSIWVGLGVIGLIWFVFSMIFPPIYMGSFKNLFYVVFFIAFMVSMFTEDTIETQAGVTFFIFFNSLFLFLYQHDTVFEVKKIKE